MRFLLRRFAFLLVTLWAAVTINFFIPRLMPGNPAEAMMARLHGRVNPTAIKALEVAFGVQSNDNIWTQYVQYLHNTVTGKFGISLTFFPLPVSSVIRQGLWWTLGLVGVTTIVAFILGTLIGTVAGWRRGGKLDSILPPFFVVTSALPYFWVGMVLILVFSVRTMFRPRLISFILIMSGFWVMFMQLYDALPNFIDWSRVRVEGKRQRRYVTFVNPEMVKGVFVFVAIAARLAAIRLDIPLLVIEGRTPTALPGSCRAAIR